MKIYNFSSDYAFQKKQNVKPQPSAAKNEKENVENQIQARGEGDMAEQTFSETEEPSATSEVEKAFSGTAKKEAAKKKKQTL